MAGSAWTNPYTFVPFEVFTAAKANAMQDNLRALKVWTTRGDLLYGHDADQLERLAIGADGSILKVISGVPAWDQLFDSRQGGSATNWNTYGTSNYSPGAVIMQMGVLHISTTISYLSVYYGSGIATFPTSFPAVPFILVSPISTPTAVPATLYTYAQPASNQVTIYLYTTVTTTVDIAWLAIGPAS
jgi:hypothetical protein